jgi:tetratricopeptide (TPR) repeat protein
MYIRSRCRCVINVYDSAIQLTTIEVGLRHFFSQFSKSMAQRPNKKKPSRNKPPTANQRRRAEAKRLQQTPAADVRVEKAHTLWKAQRFEEAIEYYERALARDPHNAVLLIDVARAYAYRFRFADAEKLLDLAQSLYPKNAGLQRMMGESYMMIQQFDRAIECMLRALELGAQGGERTSLALDLARMYERLHDLESAHEWIDDVLKMEPKNCQAIYDLGNLERRAGNAQLAEAHWCSLVEYPSCPRNIAANSLYQLAQLNDKQNKFDASYEHACRAKRILSGAASRFLEDAWTIGRISGRSIAATTPELCDRWARAADELKPLTSKVALLTGHPRSGTTLLEQVLDSHPGAISADELQIMPDMVFARLGEISQSNDPVPQVLDRTPANELDAVRDIYWRSMEGALREPIGDRVLIDKNPELTMLLPVVARVFPEMKVLFAVRDPRDVVISCFMQRLPLNPVSVHYLTLEGTVKKYAAMMHAWLKLRGMLKNAWLEVRYEEMVAELETQARRVLDFLGLPWDDCVLKFYARAQQKHVHSPTYELVTKPVYSSSIGRWRNYEQQLAPFQEALRPFVEAFGYQPA